MTLSRRLESLRRSVIEACSRVDRDPASVQLVAVTKYASLDSVRGLIDLGHRDFGESRPQQLVERATLLEDAELSWHLIGTLQRNKVRKVLPHAAVIHSIDSLRLLENVDRLGTELGLRPRVLLEVNVSGEASKQGFSAEELTKLWPEILKFQTVDLRVFMSMSPFSEDP
jgi:pyridoxal phosphate enzyme (YggS family)